MPHEHDGKVIVFTPFARDAESIEAILTQQEIAVERVESVGTLAARLGDDVGVEIQDDARMGVAHAESKAGDPCLRGVRRQDGQDEDEHARRDEQRGEAPLPAKRRASHRWSPAAGR